jgi:hypothetical protein
MQLEEYLAEVRSIHLELARLAERCARVLGDASLSGCDTASTAALVQRQKYLHGRLTQLDALILHGD